MPARTRLLLLVAAALVVAAFIAPAPAAAQTSAQVATCPATFQVLHNDRVGRLSLPAGAYTVTLLNSSRLTCSEASDLFRQFLEDYDGRLPRPWVVNVSASSFTRGPGGSVGFRVAPAGGGGGGGGGGHYPVGGACPGTFTVEHNDRIGTFRVPEGSYRITLLSVGRMTCSQASSFFASFLQDWNGVLPRPWFLDPETGSFMRGGRNVGFRIKELVGPPNPNGGGSGNHPGRASLCGGTFRVLNNDMIGRLRLPRGQYTITVAGGLSCRQASSQFTNFLQDVDGVLPRPWTLNTQTATFSRGRTGQNFRVKFVRR